MNWKSFLLGAGAGLLAGFCASEAVRGKVRVSETKVLENVKNAFKTEGQVDGSWINFRPEIYEKYPVTTKVYRGGVTCTHDGETKQYEFIADAYTGSVLDVYVVA